jgi:hypothetical protein
VEAWSAELRLANNKMQLTRSGHSRWRPSQLILVFGGPQMHRRAALLLLVTIALTGCEGLRSTARSLADVRAVQKTLVAELHDDDITVNLANDHFLTINLINSQLRALPPAAKQAKARAIGRSALIALRHRRTIETVTVVFVVRESTGLFSSVIDARDWHTFSGAELERDVVSNRSSRPPNNKMQLTRSGHLGGGPRS